MQGQDAFHDQQRFGWDVFAPITHPQVLAKVVDRSLNGFARCVIADVPLEQMHLDGMRRIIIQFRSFFQRKMVHLNGVDLHRDSAPVETRSHASVYPRPAAAGRSTQSDDKALVLTRGAAHLLARILAEILLPWLRILREPHCRLAALHSHPGHIREWFPKWYKTNCESIRPDAMSRGIRSRLDSRGGCPHWSQPSMQSVPVWLPGGCACRH